MAGADRGCIADRLELVRLIKVAHLTKAQAARRLGYSPHWARKWWRRYYRGGEAAVLTTIPFPPGPLARFSPQVAAAALAYRQTYPHLGARRARVALAQMPELQGQPLPSARTIHRAWVHAGLVCRGVPRDTAPLPITLPKDGLHDVWEIDHQDHIRCQGIDTLLVLQSIRAPRAGLTIGADIFLGPKGAHAVPEDDLFDALRRRLAQWGRPLALSVDGGLRFLGQPQRQFPSRLELLCAGLHIAVVPIRPGRPTDHAAVERLHRTLDGVLLDVDYRGQGLEQVQSVLDRQLLDLNERFPSRAKACGGVAPLAAHPEARHTGRPYDPLCEWEEFDIAAVDYLLSGWHWHRLVGKKTGQISFADRNIRVSKPKGCRAVDLRFDADQRQMVVYEPGTTPDALGPEIKRFHCPAFDKETILGKSNVAIRPTNG